MDFICHLTFINTQLATNINFIQNLVHLVNFTQVSNLKVLFHINFFNS